MIVVDTNVVGYLFLTAEHSGGAARALTKDAAWAAPFLWRSEMRNVLLKHMQREWLSLADAQTIMARATHLMAGREYRVSSDHVLRLAANSSCTAYDCEFVALAQQLGVAPVTVDRRILRAFPDLAVSLDAFAGG